MAMDPEQRMDFAMWPTAFVTIVFVCGACTRPASSAEGGGSVDDALSESDGPATSCAVAAGGQCNPGQSCTCCNSAGSPTINCPPDGVYPDAYGITVACGECMGFTGTASGMQRSSASSGGSPSTTDAASTHADAATVDATDAELNSDADLAERASG
jgi:hypothetical protein